MDTGSIIRYLDDLFQVREIKDHSKNGLQVHAPEEITRAAFAVDACVATVEAAVKEGAQLLIVHHGLYWKDVLLAVGVHYKRLKSFMETGLGLYAVHLPLDGHPELGNNSRLAKVLGMELGEPFGDYEGNTIGRVGLYPEGRDRQELLAEIESHLGAQCLLLPFGPERIEKVGIVSGGGAALLADAVEEGCDTFLTGERTHSAFHPALESGINLFMAGHYATETLGLKALQNELETRFMIETVFIDMPTGL